MISFKEFENRRYKEEFKISSLFNISLDEVYILKEMGFEYDFNSNQFKSFLEINGEKKFVMIHHNGSDTIRISFSESDSITRYREVTVDRNEKRKELSILPLLFWLENQYNQLSKKTFGEFVEKEKSE